MAALIVGGGSKTQPNPWGRYARRRTWVVFVALCFSIGLVTMLMQPWWSQDNRHVALHKLGSLTDQDVDKPAYVPLRPIGSESEPEAHRENIELGDESRKTYLYPGESGIILSSNQSISSPNGAYTLSLQPDGDLVLMHNAHGPAEPVWWTSTGDARTPNGHSLVLTPTPTGAIINLTAEVNDIWFTAWHSDLEPACRDRVLSSTTTTRKLGLSLSDSGRLTLLSTCHLHTPPPSDDNDISKADRHPRSLAIIIAGLHRTLPQTCTSHMRHLVQNPHFTRVDVFAYILHPNAHLQHTQNFPALPLLEARIRSCYAPHLRTLTLLPAASVEEDYPGGPTNMLRPCGRKLRKLNNQLKTLREAGREYWEWTVGNGVVHDVVLRIRPDTLFGEEGKAQRGEVALPGFRDVERGEGRLVLVQPRGEHYFWCARSSGRVGVGPSDQIAYGPPAQMSHYLNMQADFPSIISLASNPDRPAHRDFSGCETLPSGPGPEDCPKPAPCSIECMVAWYLESKGVEFQIEWGWDQSILRGK